MILATINVFYRDMGIIMETLMLAWFFVTPVFWNYEQTLGATRSILGMNIPISRLARILNPMASCPDRRRGPRCWILVLSTAELALW